MSITRRTFSRTVGLGLVGAALPAAAQRKLDVRVGHTGITWPWGNAPGGGPPRLTGPEPIATVVGDVSALGFAGLELFSWQITGMEAFGGLGPLLERHKLPLVSSYTGVNLTDPAQRQATIASAVATGKVVKKLGGTVMVIGPNGVRRDSFDFAASKANILSALNEVGRALTDLGLTPVLHQHTGTCIESRDETYAIMEAVDTKHMKFGPDIGQLQKGGVDPVAVVKAFLPVVEHMHFKDWVGGPSMAGYCPLGMGKVNLVGILDLMEGRKLDGMIMVELDRGGEMPYTPRETAQISRDWLVKHGVPMKG